MIIMKQTALTCPIRVALGLAMCGSLFLASCGGGGGKSSSASPTAGGSAQLVSLHYGRLVDIYSYRRLAASRTDRRDTFNRSPVLVARDVVISPSVTTQPLFDAVGAENKNTDYRFMPFDVNVGHDELLILWDNTTSDEQDDFDRALQFAQLSLVEVPGSYRSQNSSIRPIPVIPRNAALRLTFDRDLAVGPGFFAANLTAVQLLEFPRRSGDNSSAAVVPRGSESDHPPGRCADSRYISDRQRGGFRPDQFGDASQHRQHHRQHSLGVADGWDFVQFVPGGQRSGSTAERC